jgi:hypothetical protein
MGFVSQAAAAAVAWKSLVCVLYKLEAGTASFKLFVSNAVELFLWIFILSPRILARSR